MVEDSTDELKNVPLIKIGPIQLGDKPITKTFIVQHPQANQMISGEIKDEYKELLKELESEGIDIALVVTVFQSALDAFAEAQKCYNAQIYNPAVGACRDAIDNAIYAALTRKKTEIKYTFEIKNEVGKVAWSREFAKTIEASGLLTQSEISEIQYNVRDQGNFGTHLAEKRDEQLSTKRAYKWTKEVAATGRIKQDTSQPETAEVLEHTKSYLKLIIKRYFSESFKS